MAQLRRAVVERHVLMGLSVMWSKTSEMCLVAGTCVKPSGTTAPL